jgi:hypothetical protein
VEAPGTNCQGSFDTILLPAPDDWPYAIPHLYAVNIVSDPGMIITGWSASPNGQSNARSALDIGRSKVELIGFWHGEYKIIETKTFPSPAIAEEFAKETYKSIPTKFLLRNGNVMEENGIVQITGDWPVVWNFVQLRDIGVFLGYLQMLLKNRNKNEQAQRLKESITPAWPPTEIILVFQQSLQLARKEFLLDTATRKLIDKALRTVKRWLKG